MKTIEEMITDAKKEIIDGTNSVAELMGLTIEQVLPSFNKAVRDDYQKMIIRQNGLPKSHIYSFDEQAKFSALARIIKDLDAGINPLV